jgi:hypothetical protein
MFRFNLTLSILVSIVFVGGAIWLRASQTKSANESLGLESVPNSEVSILEGSPQDIYLGEKATSTQNLNQTDLLGRQLFSDYLNLSSKGQTTPDRINTLANSYADNILNLQTSSKVERNRLTITADTIASLNSYGTSIVTLRIRYGDKIEKEMKDSGISDISDPKFADFMSNVSQLYKEAAADLVNMPVPQSLADNHLKLINNYLSSAEAAKAMANVTSDPLGAYAAINTHAKNEKEEDLLLGNIQATLAASGIIFSSTL